MFEKTDAQFGRGACKLPDPGRNNLMNEGWGKTIKVTARTLQILWAANQM